MALSSDVKLHYELPTTVEYARSGWLSTFQSAATVSGLLAAVAAQMIVFFKDDKNFVPKEDPRKEPILTLAYVALILSIGATISSLILTDSFADIPTLAARSPFGLESSIKTKSHKTESSQTEDPKDELYSTSDWGLLEVFGLRKSAKPIVIHWLLSLLLSSICTTLAIVIYSIAQEHQRTTIIVSITACFALYPVVQFFFSLWSGKPQDPNSGLHVGMASFIPHGGGKLLQY